MGACLVFLYPITDGWTDTEAKLTKLMDEHGGADWGGEMTLGRRETYGFFDTREEAKACGEAAYPLYIQFLSWSIEEVQVTN